MVIATPPQLTMWYNNLDGDHRRTLNKYVSALTEFINMNGCQNRLRSSRDIGISNEWCPDLEPPKLPQL